MIESLRTSCVERLWRLAQRFALLNGGASVSHFVRRLPSGRKGSAFTIRKGESPLTPQPWSLKPKWAILKNGRRDSKTPQRVAPAPLTPRSLGIVRAVGEVIESLRAMRVYGFAVERETAFRLCGSEQNASRLWLCHTVRGFAPTPHKGESPLTPRRPSGVGLGYRAPVRTRKTDGEASKTRKARLLRWEFTNRK